MVKSIVPLADMESMKCYNEGIGEYRVSGHCLVYSTYDTRRHINLPIISIYGNKGAHKNNYFDKKRLAKVYSEELGCDCKSLKCLK